MLFSQIASLAIYLATLLAVVFLGLWLGGMPRERLANVLCVFAAIGMLVLLGLASVIAPSPTS